LPIGTIGTPSSIGPPRGGAEARMAAASKARACLRAAFTSGRVGLVVASAFALAGLHCASTSVKAGLAAASISEEAGVGSAGIGAAPAHPMIAASTPTRERITRQR
jgi:hypothetical protein